ncbi:carbohydrate sulfotransferase 12 [Misgurnus anguillicaudatus]|uniref:carbohydrate sulfotransferase 12 n=1 Tax=Misgurnus anguillicaudatus TaxID=75329 RepID=UPI00243610DB|nr:carbohydrate sulfotransferase 12-like [Misgurnus anguillicaudatus]
MGILRQLQCFLLMGTMLIVIFIIIYWDDVAKGTYYVPSVDLNSSLDDSKKSSWSVKLNQTTPLKHILEDNNLTLNLKVRQANRTRMVKELCLANSSLHFPGKLKTFDQIPSHALDHLIVDDRHGVIYCYVPKVACTNWKRVMIVLSQNLKRPDGAAYRDPLDIPSYLSHNATLHLTFNRFWRRFGRASRRLMHHKLKTYTKFIFVRDPFVRLISAFRNKFDQPNEDFYKQFGSVMLQRYAQILNPPSSAKEAFATGIRPSFANFVKYLLDSQTENEEPFNEHWRQVYRLCHPCQIEYDFVGKLETLDEDAKHLLKILGMDQIHFPPGYHDRTATNWEREWFATISLADRTKLYNLYEPDFRLFGYDKPETLLHH